MDSTKLTIGINIVLQHSFFSHGLPTTAFSLADALTSLGHNVVLVNINGLQEWFDDCLSLQSVYPKRNLVEWSEKNYNKLDLFIDIDGFLIPDQRRRIANRVVVFLRKPVFLSEIEGSVYPIQQPVRNIRDCDAVWLWEHFGKQDAHLVELLSKKPVYHIPYTWSEKGVESYHSGSSWLQASNESTSWTCHITETNSSVASSCILPMVIARYAKTHTSIPFTHCCIHNTATLEQQQYFKENILNHCQCDGLKFEQLGRQRISDWRNESKSFVLSHTRFIAIKSYLLDCIWNGIPLIHNSLLLKELGCGLERLYYEDNSIISASKAMQAMTEDWTNRVGFFASDGLSTIRSKLKTWLNPLQHKSKWNAAITNIPTPLQLTPTPTLKKQELHVGICDMYDDFNYTYNFWLLLLQAACPTLKIRTFQANTSTQPMDLLIFGPFGSTWTQFPASVPKVATTGENTPSIHEHGVYLNLGFESTDLSKGIYRFPLWLQYIDWFGADVNRIVNPKPMPISCFKEHSDEFLQNKKKFCAFIVSNPSNSIRNEAFHQLSTYKDVDSAGRLYNTVGNSIFTSVGGGGGGELTKLDFLKDYKFCLTYENSQKDGYITEKLLAAKAAGCIPIYWGANDVERDFAAGSFLNVNSGSTTAELIKAVKAIDTNSAAWLTMAKQPCISLEQEQKRLAEAAKLILQPILGNEVIIPNVLGCITSSPVVKEYWNGETLLVSFASHRFLESLIQWLEPIRQFHNHDKAKKALVYIGDDVDEFQFNLLRAEYDFATFRRLPTKSVAVAEFPDLWEPQHFAWKLWIFHTLVNDPTLKNTLVWYSDVGSSIVRWPEKWLSIAKEEGVCILEDKEQKNDQWCHEVFCKRLNVSEQELKSQQLWAGSLGFLGGSKKALALFDEAWKLGQTKELIVGPKWAGLLADGRPYGHRHDQSILSILRLRHNLTVYPLEKIYNHESLRRTFKEGQAIYVHRGIFREHVNFAPRIGEVHIISLERRKDRISKFKANHESWTKEVFLRPAYDGCKVQLSPQLARLFAPNDFMWKKAVLGCAMSHLSLWIDLATEQECCENYLILEDDVQFEQDWLTLWKEASKSIPEDYDVLYLGGVLPPNKEGFKQNLESVSEFWSRIKPNRMFGQSEPTSYFHFCNYAYILSRKGAQKVMEAIQKESGYRTSADHMICNRITELKHYILNPLVAGCYQDKDPKYQTSVFNNFNRIDQFDSDLWNNDERFSAEEVRLALQTPIESNTMNITHILENAYTQNIVLPTDNRLYTIGPHLFDAAKQLETTWLESCLGSSLGSVEHLAEDHSPLSSNPIFLVAKPYMDLYKAVFAAYEAADKSFYAIHLSDEHTLDPIDWYSLKSCKGVVRNYVRQECSTMKHVLTIPLGYNRKSNESCGLEERKLVWSFFGTGWMDRAKLLESWSTLKPNACTFFSNWMDSNQLSAEAYSRICLNSILMPCPKGQSVETFRFWEALEHGAIPIYVRSQGDTLHYNFLVSKLPILSIPSWQQATGIIQALLQNKETLAQYRTTLLQKWSQWKKDLSVDCRRVLGF
jgi:GR25 family glycosyltransferase involved in LPS biosynthesis